MLARPLAASLLLLSACGDVSTVSSDAGQLDASTDAAPERGTVSLVLHTPFGSSNEPIPGATMLVVMPDGTVIGDDVTDDEGLASVDDVPGGAIMLVFPELEAGASGYLTIAVYDVHPGDEVSFGGRGASGASLGTMTISVPAYDDPSPTYHIANGCHHLGGETTSEVLSFYEPCVVDGDADVLAWVVGQSGELLAYLDANRPFESGMPMDLTALSWQTPDSLDVTLTDIPAEARRMEVNANQLFGEREYGPIVDLDDIELEDTDELTAHVPDGFGDSTSVQLAFEPNQPSIGAQLLVHRAEEDIDWSLREELLPWYSGGVYSASDRHITWTRTSGRAPDAHYIILSWAEQESPVEGAWYTVSPADWTEVVLPPLPDEWEDYLPDQPASSTVQIYAVESSLVDGYDEARLLGFDLVDEDPVNFTPPGTTVRMSLGVGAGF